MMANVGIEQVGQCYGAVIFNPTPNLTGNDFYTLHVKVWEGGTDWGWGVVVNVVKKPPVALGSLPPALSSSRGVSYIVDTLLHCSIGLNEIGSKPKPCPPSPGEKGEMHVVS